MKKKGQGDNNGIGDWISVSNPDELFEHLDEEDWDLKKFNKELSGFQILDDLIIEQDNEVYDMLNEFQDYENGLVT